MRTRLAGPMLAAMAAMVVASACSNSEERSDEPAQPVQMTLEPNPPAAPVSVTPPPASPTSTTKTATGAPALERSISAEATSTVRSTAVSRNSTAD